jgi:hypothetical protein
LQAAIQPGNSFTFPWKYLPNRIYPLINRIVQVSAQSVAHSMLARTNSIDPYVAHELPLEGMLL